jgi:hypothetical protein
MQELITWRQRLRLRSEKDSGDADRQSRKDERKLRNAQDDDRRSKSKSKLDKSRSPGRKSKKVAPFPTTLVFSKSVKPLSAYNNAM